MSVVGRVFFFVLNGGLLPGDRPELFLKIAPGVNEQHKNHGISQSGWGAANGPPRAESFLECRHDDGSVYRTVCQVIAAV